MVNQLGRLVGMFKIGKQLFVSGGPDFVREVRQRGAEVFLDLKFHDTPRALMRTAMEATRLGVRMFDIHLNGHADSIAKVRAEINRLCQNEGLRKPHIVAVAMLMGVAREGGEIVIAARKRRDGGTRAACGDRRSRWGFYHGAGCPANPQYVRTALHHRDAASQYTRQRKGICRWRGGDSCGRGLPGGRQSDLEGDRADASGARDRRANRSWASHRTSSRCADDYSASSLE